MAQTGTAPGTDAVIGDWYPQSLRPTRPAILDTRLRSALLGLVIGLHVLVLGWLLPLLDPPSRSDERALQLEFTTPTLPEPVEVMLVPMPKPAADNRSAARKKPRLHRALQAQPPVASAGKAPQSQAERLEIYGSDGRLKLPPDLLDQVDRQFGDKRVFSYQVPRMDEGAKLWDRPQAVVYEETRFAQYWKPDQDLLTALLTEMVEKTTKEVRIKLPGKSNSTVVCRVSLLAFGGGCGVLTPGSDYVGPVDDPNTLSPEEDRQCQAWWEQIVGARTQDVWRKTRKLYEESCRKPLERKPAG